MFSTKTKDLYEGKGLFGRVFNIERKIRDDFVIKNIKGKTVLEVGAYDGRLSQMLESLGIKSIPTDISPNNGFVKYADVMELPFQSKSFDTVVALDVLEHIENPVKALDEIKRVATKQVFVCVPNEPYFTLFRFIAFRGWCNEHLTALTPRFLKLHLGDTKSEMTFMLKREWIGEWLLED